MRFTFFLYCSKPDWSWWCQPSSVAAILQHVAKFISSIWHWWGRSYVFNM